MEIAPLLQIQKGVTAIIGGGGKTTLMMTLARELSSQGTVIVSTSTKIFPPKDLPVLSPLEAREALKKHRIVCIASPHPSGKLAAPECSFGELAQLADYVLVEADGSKGLPLKAHASHEPVIPPESLAVIYVVGADGFGKPVSQVTHRPELFTEITGCSLEERMTPELAARGIRIENLAQIILVNKVESNEDFQNAARLASELKIPVVAGSLYKGEYVCLQ